MRGDSDQVLIAVLAQHFLHQIFGDFQILVSPPGHAVGAAVAVVDAQLGKQGLLPRWLDVNATEAAHQLRIKAQARAWRG